MNQQDELRKLVETWKGEAKRIHTLADKERSKAGRDALMAQSVRYWMCADQLSALLDRHAVAEPLGESLEVRRKRAIEWAKEYQERTGKGPGDQWYAHAWMCGYFNHPRASSKSLNTTIIEQFEASAHAAEQPKLTEATQEFATEFLAFAKYAFGDIRIAWPMTVYHLAEMADVLLTSPVAPPPRNDKREGAERTARLLCETRGHTGRRPCDFCQMQIDACLRETEPLRTCYCGTPKEPHCESVHAPPPVAPGEQPQVGHGFITGTAIPENFPPSQERASDDLEED